MNNPDLLYKCNVKYGSKEFVTARPGYSRLVTKDENGNITSDVESHLVCMKLGFDGQHCIYCGKFLGGGLSNS